MAGSPRIIAQPTTRSPAACRRARVRQGQAFGGAEKAPSVAAAAPRRRWKYAVGTEECSRRGSNKRMECKGRPDWRDAPLTKKAPYKPDALIGHVRFDERGWETERCRMAQATAPILDSTIASFLGGAAIQLVSVHSGHGQTCCRHDPVANGSHLGHQPHRLCVIEAVQRSRYARR